MTRQTRKTNTRTRNNDRRSLKTPEALAVAMADPVEFAARFGDAASPGDWARFHNAYAAATDLQTPTPDAAPGAPPGDTGGGPDITTQLGQVFSALSPRNARTKDAAGVLASYGSEQPTEGGFLLPRRLSDTLLALSVRYSIIRPGAMVIPMPGPRLGVPSTDDTDRTGDQTGRSGPRFAGVQATWVSDSEVPDIQTGKFKLTELDVSKLLLNVEVPIELAADASALGAYLTGVLPQALAFTEDSAFLTGDGFGKPKGILRSGARITISRANASEISYGDVVTMASRLLPLSWPDAVWVANPDTLPQLGHLVQEIEDDTGVVGGSHVPLDRGPELAILGIPLRLSESMPSLGTAGDLALLDPSSYAIGDETRATVEASEHHRFGRAMVAYRVRQRVDGRPWINSPITPQNGANTLSPVITLGS